MAKLRCGILPIQIELGRFRGLSERDRICPICRLNVESELHFMFECQAYENYRDNFITDTGMNPLASSIEKIKYCMQSCQRLTAKYIVKIWDERQKLLIV